VAEEPVYSPDQLKPGNRKWGRIGAIGTAVLILMLFWGNHEGNTENIYLLLTALALIGAVIADAVLRRNGLKSNDQ
jgi:sugar phosphate permease